MAVPKEVLPSKNSTVPDAVFGVTVAVRVGVAPYTMGYEELANVVAVLIFGLTGPLGKLIEAPEEVLVFYRLIFAITGIYIYFKLSFILINKTSYPT